MWRSIIDPAAEGVSARAGLLSPDERARAERFRFDVHRDRFILCRAAQREVLAAYTGLPPGAIEFHYSTHGKPALAGDAGAAIRFNTSNSGNIAVFAVTAGADVGVDVEEERVVADSLELAGRFFSPAEIDALGALPAAQRHRAFLACWTRKEAFIKAVGLGVSMDLSAFDVSVRPDDAPALLATRPDAAVARRWSMYAADVGPGYICALAAEAPVTAVRVFEHEPGRIGP